MLHQQIAPSVDVYPQTLYYSIGHCSSGEETWVLVGFFVHMQRAGLRNLVKKTQKLPEQDVVVTRHVQ